MTPADGRDGAARDRDETLQARAAAELAARVSYGRLLAYGWVKGPDGVEFMVNAEMVRLGYAAVLTVPPNVRHAELFRKLAAEAREQHRGLWAP